MWRHDDNYEDWSQDNLFLLPSDSLKRTDLVLIKGKQWDEAQAEKERLENLQRADKKLRGHK